MKKSRKQSEWIRVKSSAVRAVRYDPSSRNLSVRFWSGDEYQYKDVPPSKFRALLDAESIGAFVNKEIKPQHSFQERDVETE